MVDNTPKSQVVEQIVTISKPLRMRNGVKVLFPDQSESVAWFDGKKHKTTIKASKDNRILKVQYFDGTTNTVLNRSIEVNTKNVYCFYSQLIECISKTNFLNLSRKKKVGVMNFYIVWDSFPFFNELFLYSKNEIASRAQFGYVEEKNGEVKYQLNVDDHMMTYFIQDNQLRKFYWSAHGIGQEKNLRGGSRMNQLGRLFICGVSGLTLTEEERSFIAENEVTGVLLFAKNYQNKNQLIQLTNELRAVRSDILIAVDHEGGGATLSRGFYSLSSHDVCCKNKSRL